MSNGDIFIFFAMTDEKLLAFYVFKTSDDSSSLIGPKNMKIPPFDAYHHDDSGKLCFMFLRDLGSSKCYLTFCKKFNFLTIFLILTCKNIKTFPHLKVVEI